MEKSTKELAQEIKELEEQKRQALEIEQYDKAAISLYNSYDSFIKAGFTEEQSWELVKICIQKK